MRNRRAVGIQVREVTGCLIIQGTLDTGKEFEFIYCDLKPLGGFGAAGGVTQFPLLLLCREYI